MSDQFTVHVIRRTQAQPVRPPGDAISVDADRFGNVLFRDERIPANVFEKGLTNCVAAGKAVVEKMAHISKEFQVETVTLKLTLDATVGVAFVGDTGIEAGIEVEFKRIKPAGTPDT